MDIFRVSGGKVHDYRLFSDIASSDDPKGAMSFSGLGLAPMGPLAGSGAGLNEEQIFGLKDSVACKPESENWQANWMGAGAGYRLWFLSPVDEVIASSGPGQGTKARVGRRVRYLDAVRRGTDISSTFVAVHEPLDKNHAGAIDSVEQIPGLELAGGNATGLNIRTRWRNFLVLYDFSNRFEVQGVVFKGKFALMGQPVDGKNWFLPSEAETFRYGSIGFSGQPPVWSGPLHAHAPNRFRMEKPVPPGWPGLPDGCQNYALIHDGETRTGYPVRSVSENKIAFERFPLVAADSFALPSFSYHEKQTD